MRAGDRRSGLRFMGVGTLRTEAVLRPDAKIERLVYSSCMDSSWLMGGRTAWRVNGTTPKRCTRYLFRSGCAETLSGPANSFSTAGYPVQIGGTATLSNPIPCDRIDGPRTFNYKMYEQVRLGRGCRSVGNDGRLHVEPASLARIEPGGILFPDFRKYYTEGTALAAWRDRRIP